MDKESSRGIGMWLLAPRLNNRILIFFGSPVPALASAKAAAGKSTLVRALQWDALAFLPHSTDTDYKLLHIHTHKDMHSPPHPRSLASVALNRQPDKRVCDQHWKNGCGTGWLLAEAWLLPLLQSHVSMVYVLLLLLRCFSCSHTVLPKEHSLGVIFFSSPSSCYAVFFFNSLSSCSVYPLVIYVCCVCMDRLMANFAGTCD